MARKSPVVLAGNNLAAAYVLELLLERVGRDEILAIAPERKEAWHASLVDAAGSAGVRCLTPDDVNDDYVLEQVVEHRPRLLLSVYYTQVFAAPLLGLVDGPVVNFHPSLLPRHRGVAPIVWAIADGDQVTGLTVHHIDEGIDTGPVIIQRRLPIHPDDTGFRLHLKMARLVRSTAAELLRAFFAGSAVPPGHAQSGSATYHSRRDPQLNRIDWTRSRQRIRDVVRALAPPLPGAVTELEGEELVVARVEYASPGPGGRVLRPGMVEIARRGPPLVWAADGPLAIVAFLDADGAVLPGEELPSRRGLLAGQVLG